MKNSPSLNQLDLDKDVKHHKSAHVPADSRSLNKKFYKGNDINNTSPNKEPNDEIFNIQSNSIFAYQEFDRFSSFCDNEEKNIKSEDANTNKDEYNNCSTSFSLGINEDSFIKRNMSKRNSYEVSPNFSQYLTFQNQVLSGFQNFEGSGGMGPPGNIPSFDEFVNNQINNIYNKRRNTQKMNRNYFNSIFKKNGTQNQELINNFENRKKSNSQIYPKGYQINYNNNINQFNNNFFMNQQFSGNNIEDININNQKEIIIPDNNLNEQNKIEPNDFLFPINEYNEVVRKKSNSLALKNNTMFEQNNQINFPYKQNNNNNNNNNNFFQSHSKNNQKNHKFSSHSNNDLYIFKKSNSSIYLICQDQSKCRNIQDQLEQNKNDIQYIQNFFEQIKPNLINIMTHQFGNYVIQKFLEILIYQENKQLFTEVISLLHQNNSLFKISINNYGTRVVQKTLEKLIESGYNKVETVELNNCIKKLIEEHLYDLCRDKNGNHVYQKLLKVFHSETEENNNFLYDYLASISVDVAFLQQGATIFTTAIGLGSHNQKEKICDKVIKNLDKLINNKYGNYSVQAIIKTLKDEKKIIEPIYLYITSNIIELSKNKFGSNVVDTFIMKKDEFSQLLINDMIKNNQITEIIKDQFGNYVIQKAMSISDQETLDKIIDLIKPIIPELLLSSHGKKVVNKISQQYNVTFNEG
jgi:hypothetical protein